MRCKNGYSLFNLQYTLNFTFETSWGTFKKQGIKYFFSIIYIVLLFLQRSKNKYLQNPKRVENDFKKEKG